ncbi:MAG: S8 family serine peptidase, partial [Ilumatobacteraceae bacterium]
SARDYDGHGTHTASTAAGNRDVPASIFGIDRGVVSGIAPRARVIAYSACGNLGCVTSDLVASIDQAVVDGVDVINYSIGGGASLTDPADIAFLFAADANVWVAASASNDGPGPETVGGPASVPWLTAVGASTHDRTFANAARTGDGRIVTGASITPGTGGTKALVDAAALGNELCESTKPFNADITGQIALCLRGGNARVDKSLAVFNAGGAGMILYNPNDAQALVTDNHWVASTHVDYTSGLAVKAYIASAGAGATASITAGARVGAQGSVMADFSSRGPNPVAPDIIKPDITAPGVNVLAGNTPTPANGSAPGQLFQSISGTSMSSPHVAGLYALLRQAHPEWTAAMAKSAIMTTARQDVVKEDLSTPADPFDMGAGHIDPAGRPDRAGSVFSPGLVYDAGLFEYFGFLCGADSSAFANPEGTCGALEAGGIPTTPRDLNLASIGAAEVAGTATVTRTVTSVADRRTNFNVRVDAPDGFDVRVEPRQLRLQPGESATYTVTFTNTGAPADAWRYGSLTWRGGGHEVRSPIAVNGSVLAAPVSVSGSGTEGSVEIPVQFGYEGTYA